jgi:hypothetical protein
LFTGEEEMSEPSADDLTKRLFVCCGYVTLESGKPGIAIAEVMAEPVEPSDETASQFHIPGTGDLARLRIYERKLLRHFSVGSTYEMEANDKSIRPSTARWQGRYHNDEVVRTWQAMADAYEIAERARKAEAAEKRTDLNFEALEPFRRAWLQTNSIGRLALEVRVLAYLRMQKVK